MFMIEREHEQRQADGEDRLVLDRAGRHVTLARRADERGHRLRPPPIGLNDEGRLLARSDETIIVSPTIARDREHEARDDAGDRGRHDDPRRHLETSARRARRRPPAVRAARPTWRPRRARRPSGCTMTPTTMPALERVERADVEPDVLEQRRHEEEREVAEDDRRDAGQHLERRASATCGRRSRVLGQVDRGAEPERDA